MLFQFRVTFLCQRIRTIYFKKNIPHCGTSIPHISAINLKVNGIGSVMTIKLVFVASPLSIKEKKQTGWLVIRIICPSGPTCLSADYFFGELAI
jgi:hypothetical protein